MGKGSSDALGCSIGHGLDPALLWLWRRLAAVAPIRPLAWELPRAAGVALKRLKEKKKELQLNKIGRDVYQLSSLGSVIMKMKQS